MAEAAEGVSELAPATIRLKWPNDLVIEDPRGVAKVAGVLGETDGLGTPDPRRHRHRDQRRLAAFRNSRRRNRYRNDFGSPSVRTG